ncbi:MAG: aminotransferase class I/II-fold pyridoxal phosphate-dependent enzyme, partial [Saprospiraceae bacterium]|nr:aminotransferase class I/II-fold pyridoxal phosphate-dependent enzyme [Saprospiraceae bacterium]
MKNYQAQIKSKLPGTKISIFSIMSQLANEYKAINLSQGFPDFDISSELIELVNKYMQKGFNQYSPMQGVKELRDEISKKVERTYGIKYDADKEINITAGATQALFSAITAFVKENDEVIIFEPAYDSYIPAVKLNGGTIRYAHLKTPDYHIDWNEVKMLINHNTRMIIINSPHNPSGSVLTSSDMKELEKLTNNTNIIILSDEVYEHLIFDGITHESVCKYPKLAERSLAVFSFGKTFHATGWKMGYCLAPENLMAEFRKAHQFIVFTCNTPMQYAIAEFLKDENNYLKLGEFYQQKRDYFLKLIKDSRFKIIPCHGTYFQLLDYSAISDEKEVDFAIRLTKEFGIASIPISPFYSDEKDNKTLRFCFAKT